MIQLILFYHLKDLHQTCPYNQALHYYSYNQTLNYHFREISTPLGKSIQSIIQMQSYSTDSILWFKNIYIRLVFTIIIYSIPHTIRIYIIIFEKKPPP